MTTPKQDGLIREWLEATVEADESRISDSDLYRPAADDLRVLRELRAITHEYWQRLRASDDYQGPMYGSLLARAETRLVSALYPDAEKPYLVGKDDPKWESAR